jgi:hypothetical protein
MIDFSGTTMGWNGVPMVPSIVLAASGDIVEVSNSNAEKTLLAATLPANILAGGNAVRLRALVELVHVGIGNITFTLKFYFANPEVFTAIWTVGTNTTFGLVIDWLITNDLNNNVQTQFISAIEAVNGFQAAPVTLSSGMLETGANISNENITIANDILVSVQPNLASINNKCILRGYALELIPKM